MDTNWAAEHLQVIRTLMERATIYRRALAPMMFWAGTMGLIASILGCFLKIDAPRSFIGYWLAVAAITVVGTFLLVRREAFKEGDRFWSPPTRRVTEALLPPLMAGLIISGVLFFGVDGAEPKMARMIGMFWLPLGWIVLYGCAMHAAGFFMPRGIKLFGWLLILGGCVFFVAGIPDRVSRETYAHGLMGLFFGIMHLGYGMYLYFTEKRNNAT